MHAYLWCSVTDTHTPVDTAESANLFSEMTGISAAGAGPSVDTTDAPSNYGTRVRLTQV